MRELNVKMYHLILRPPLLIYHLNIIIFVMNQYNFSVMCIQMMRHVFEQSGIKGAIAAVAKLPDNAVSFFEMYDDYAWLYFHIPFLLQATVY